MTGSKGEGKGKGKAKGKGGVWQLDGEEEGWNLEQPEGEQEVAIEAVDKWNYAPIRTEKFEAEIFSVDRPGEARAVSEVKGWEKVRVQVDSGALGTVGPKEIAKAFATKRERDVQERLCIR